MATAPLPTAVSIEVHHGLAPLVDLLPRWRALDARAAVVPMGADVQLAVATADRSSSCVTLTASEGDRLVAIWPLQVLRLGPLRLARRLAAAIQTFDGPTVDHPPPGEVLAEWRGRVIDEMVRTLHRRGLADLLHLRFLPDGPAGPAVPSLRELVQQAGESPWLDTRRLDTTEAVLGRMSRERRKSTRRGLRALAERGEVRFVDVLEPGLRQARVALALQLKRQWLRKAGGFSLPLSLPWLPRCLLTLSADPALIQQVKVFVLEVGGRPAAIELGWRAGRDYHAYLGSFDPDFAKGGAGAALTLEIMAWCGRHGVERASLLPPTTDFKRAWTDQTDHMWAATFPLTDRGRVCLPLLRDGPVQARRLLEQVQALTREDQDRGGK